MRPAVGARGSFALSGVIEFAGFTSLSYPVWFNSRRPHHIQYPVTGTTQAHGGPKILGISCFGLPPGAAGVYISAPVWPEAPEGRKKPVRFSFCFEVGHEIDPIWM